MRKYTTNETWPGYGLVAGAAVGAIVLALTGSVLWLAILPGLGLVIGSALGAMHGGGSGSA